MTDDTIDRVQSLAETGTATEGMPQTLSRAQYEDYKAQIEAAPEAREFPEIASVLGSGDATAAALRERLANYSPSMIAD